MHSSCLLLLGTAFTSVTGFPGDKGHSHHEGEDVAVVEECHGKVTVIDTETALTTTTLPTTCYVEVTDYVYINSTITQQFTENMTTTLHHTVKLTDTEFETETETETETDTETDTFAVTVTDTDSVTVTTTDTVPATITTYTTRTETLLQTTYDPCPKSCSIDAATVTLFYWPTDRAYSYPSTYVDEDMDYTFTSPSVYMLIPSAKGTNSKGQHVGPSTTNWILGLDLDEVSTIADGPSGSLTRQLELSDLGTNCPQSMDPKAIATLSDSRCAPILAAPTTVSSWAYPCNACGRFGLFDPPYAVPTVTGLIEPTTREESIRSSIVEIIPSTAIASTTSAGITGTLYVVYHEDGEPVSTETRESVGMIGESTISTSLPSLTQVTSTVAAVPEMTETQDVIAEPPMVTPTEAPSVLPTPSDPDVVATASGRMVTGDVGAVIAGIAMTLSIMFLSF